MHKDEHFIGYTPRYIALPKSYAVWDTQTNCWVSETENNEQSIAQETAQKFNEWNKKTENYIKRQHKQLNQKAFPDQRGQGFDGIPDEE